MFYTVVPGKLIEKVKKDDKKRKKEPRSKENRDYIKDLHDRKRRISTRWADFYMLGTNDNEPALANLISDCVRVRAQKPKTSPAQGLRNPLEGFYGGFTGVLYFAPQSLSGQRFIERNRPL